jgi:predicted dehydrogenase
MNIGIVGGGFGLYGYLPALMQIPDTTVTLPARYKAFVKERDDINCFYNEINWVEDDSALLKSSEGVVIATPPAQQVVIAMNCLSYDNISHMFLEKPLAASPSAAVDLLEALETSGKKFRLGYNFRLTDWGQALRTQAGGLKELMWTFQAHHYVHQLQNWKRDHTQGGGALRFYGIHVIALLAELGYTDVSYSEIMAEHQHEAETWHAELTGDNLVPCKISVASNCHEVGFTLIDGNGKIHNRTQPFELTEQQKTTGKDQRISVLIKGLVELLDDEQQYYEWYRSANALWANIEKRTVRP